MRWQYDRPPKMDIAYTVRRSFPGPGGIATAMRSVARELATRHRVRVWAARVDDEPLTRLNASSRPQRFRPFWSDGVEIRPIPMGVARLTTSPMGLLTVPGARRVGYKVLRSATAPLYAGAVGARLRADWGAPDIVHCWGGEHVNWAGASAARAGKVPVVVTPFAHPKAWGDDPLNVAFYRAADLVLALLPSEAAFYASLGVEEAKVWSVGVPVTPLPDDGPDVRAAHGLSDEPLVLFLGVKEPYKGYGLVLAAAHEVWGKHPGARFAFVGPETAASEADFAGIADPRVVRVGRVSDAEVGSWMRAATMLVLPSVSEIMPVSILEAWSVGRPVVAARWWCAPDLIAHGRDGLLVDADAGQLAAAITELIDDPARAAALGRAGRDKAAEYTPEAVAARHEDAYRHAIG